MFCSLLIFSLDVTPHVIQSSKHSEVNIALYIDFLANSDIIFFILYIFVIAIEFFLNNLLIRVSHFKLFCVNNPKYLFF